MSPNAFSCHDAEVDYSTTPLHPSSPSQCQRNTPSLHANFGHHPDNRISSVSVPNPAPVLRPPALHLELSPSNAADVILPYAFAFRLQVSDPPTNNTQALVGRLAGQQHSTHSREQTQSGAKSACGPIYPQALYWDDPCQAQKHTLSGAAACTLLPQSCSSMKIEE